MLIWVGETSDESSMISSSIGGGLGVRLQWIKFDLMFAPNKMQLAYDYKDVISLLFDDG